MSRQTSQDLKEVIRDFRRDQVIDVARRLFGERGTTEVSMDEIASEAGVARSTIYVYFANRDELLRACLKRMHDQLIETISESWDLGNGPTERLRLLIVGIFEQLDESPAFLRLALATLEAVSPSGAAVGSELSIIGLECGDADCNRSRSFRHNFFRHRYINHRSNSERFHHRRRQRLIYHTWFCLGHELQSLRRWYCYDDRHCGCSI